MASRPQRSWPGKLTPTLGPWWPGRRFRCFIRCLHRKGPRMASRPQRSWPGKLTPTLGPWWPGRRFRSFIRCLHRKGPRMASRPQRSWPGKLTPTLGPWWPGRRFRCFIRCLHRKGPRMASRPQRRNFWQRRSAWYFFSRLLWVFSTCFGPRPGPRSSPEGYPRTGVGEPCQNMKRSSVISWDLPNQSSSVPPTGSRSFWLVHYHALSSRFSISVRVQGRGLVRWQWSSMARRA